MPACLLLAYAYLDFSTLTYQDPIPKQLYHLLWAGSSYINLLRQSPKDNSYRITKYSNLLFRLSFWVIPGCQVDQVNHHIYIVWFRLGQETFLLGDLHQSFCIRNPTFTCTTVIPTFHSLLKLQPLQCARGEPSFSSRLPLPCPILQLPILSLQSSLPPALQPCLSLSAAWRRAWVWTAASPGLCCLWEPLSTWMALHSMRPWQPSLLLKSTTMNLTLARLPQSGEMMMSSAGQDRGYVFKQISCLQLHIPWYMQISQNLKKRTTCETFLVSILDKRCRILNSICFEVVCLFSTHTAYSLLTTPKMTMLTL